MAFIRRLPILLLQMAVLLGQKYEYAQLDIIIVMDRSASIKQADYMKMLKVVDQLPDTFPMGLEKTQMAIVVFNTTADVITSLIGNKSEFHQHIAKMGQETTQGFTSTHRALAAVQDHVLNYDQRLEVADVMIILTDGCTNPHPEGTDKTAETMAARKEAEERAQQLRDDGVFIFLVHVGFEQCKEHQEKLVSTPASEYLVNIENYDQLTTAIFEKFKEQAEKELCPYNPLCYYKDKKKSECLGDWWRPYSAETLQCKQQKPATKVVCGMHQCEEHCHRLAKEKRQGCRRYCASNNYDEAACKACLICSNLDIPLGLQPKPPVVVPGESNGTREGLYIGVGVGVLLLVIALLVLAIVLVQRRRRERRKKMMMKAIAHQQSLADSDKSRAHYRSTGRKSQDVYATMPGGSMSPTAPPLTGPAYRLSSELGKVKSVPGRDESAAYTTSPGRQASVGVSLTGSVPQRGARSEPKSKATAAGDASHSKPRPHSRTIGGRPGGRKSSRSVHPIPG